MYLENQRIIQYRICLNIMKNNTKNTKNNNNKFNLIVLIVRMMKNRIEEDDDIVLIIHDCQYNIYCHVFPFK